jgi:hypothetical protein
MAEEVFMTGIMLALVGIALTIVKEATPETDGKVPVFSQATQTKGKPIKTVIISIILSSFMILILDV